MIVMFAHRTCCLRYVRNALEIEHIKKHKNVAFELLRKLLNDEVKTKSRKNLVQSRLFSALLEANDSAVAVLGDETLRMIARELVETVKKNVTIGWTVRESVQANLRRLVKRILKKYGYPPDKQEHATPLVLQQAALHAEEWAA